MPLRIWFWMAVFLSKVWSGVAWQPVMDYGVAFSAEAKEAPPKINPFENFTQLGTDFGWMGDGQERIRIAETALSVRAEGEWTGAWHSLVGLASDFDRTLDPTDIIGLGGPVEKMSRILAVTLDARGEGNLRLEMIARDGATRWTQIVTLSDAPIQRQRFELDASHLGRIKQLNWIAEPGCSAEIKSLGLEISRPEMQAEEWLFRVSLGKLRRNHDPVSGMTRDRAHLPPGRFDSVSVTGLHALAIATAAAEGILDIERTRDEVLRSTETLLALPKAHGFLPHFTRRDAEGVLTIHPGTEYSTVDTAIALQSIRLAGVLLGSPEILEQIAAASGALDFDAVTDSENWIHHGVEADGKTLLASTWRDWGGETALVLTQEAMVPNREPRGRMDSVAEVFRGVAFIAEIQSLLYPDFDRDEPDLVSGARWPVIRRELLRRQQGYLMEQQPDTAASKSGLFGFSAGEAGLPGAGYTAYGVDMPGLRWLHPHAMVLGLGLSGGNLAEGVGRLEASGFLYPFGLPENIAVDFQVANPMLGGLNAAFETLAAYHGWRRGSKDADVIDRASLADPMMRKGAARFYLPR